MFGTASLLRYIARIASLFMVADVDGQVATGRKTANLAVVGLRTDGEDMAYFDNIPSCY